MDGIDALVGGRAEVQAYLGPRFEASVRAGVAAAADPPTSGEHTSGGTDAAAWGLPNCKCAQCDLVRPVHSSCWPTRNAKDWGQVGFGKRLIGAAPVHYRLEPGE
jgi:hypothetical protein